MSTVKADLLTNRLGTSFPAIIGADYVKAFGSFGISGGVPALFANSTMNVSSISDLGVGVTRFIMTTPFLTAYFTPTITAYTWHHYVSVYQGDRFDTYMGEGTHVMQDGPFCSVTVSGRLA